MPLRNLSLRRPTLDDVFLELTGNRINPDEEGEPATEPGEPMEAAR